MADNLTTGTDLTVNHQRALLPIISKVLLETNVLDAEGYTHDEVLEAQSFDRRFRSIQDPEQFYCLFKRAASLFLLAKDLGRPLEFNTNSFDFPNPARHTLLANAKEQNQDNSSTRPQTKQPSSALQPDKSEQRGMPTTTPARSKKQPKPKKATSTVDTVTMKSHSHHILKLPQVGSSFVDENGRSRHHIFVQAMSGTVPSDIYGMVLDGEELRFKYKWPTDTFKVSRLLGHGRFGTATPTYAKGHDKRTKMQMEIDHMTKNGFIESMVTIRLPGLDYHLTDPEYSGHKNIVPIILDEGKTDPTIIFMFDLVKRDPSMSSKFSHQAENKMEDDLELG